MIPEGLLINEYLKKKKSPLQILNAEVMFFKLVPISNAVMEEITSCGRAETLMCVIWDLGCLPGAVNAEGFLLHQLLVSHEGNQEPPPSGYLDRVAGAASQEGRVGPSACSSPQPPALHFPLSEKRETWNPEAACCVVFQHRRQLRNAHFPRWPRAPLLATPCFLYGMRLRDCLGRVSPSLVIPRPSQQGGVCSFSGLNTWYCR